MNPTRPAPVVSAPVAAGAAHVGGSGTEVQTVDTADMTGKTVVITGANSGIGFETAVALAGAGAQTVVATRDQQRGQAAVTRIGERSKSERVELVVFDLGSLASVRAGAAQILERFDRVDVLVNNAGLVLTERRETVDGLEATFAVNHLGPFLLTQLLLDRISEHPSGRVVNVASTAHKSVRHGLDFADLQSHRHYRGMQVYAKSKLANIYFTTELARRLDPQRVIVNCLHPGTVATGFARDGDAAGMLAFGVKVSKPFMLNPARGARTSIYLASSPDVDGVTGRYFVKCRPSTPSKVAQDHEAARRLWEASEALVAAR